MWLTYRLLRQKKCRKCRRNISATTCSHSWCQKHHTVTTVYASRASGPGWGLYNCACWLITTRQLTNRILMKWTGLYRHRNVTQYGTVLTATSKVRVNWRTLTPYKVKTRRGSKGVRRATAPSPSEISAPVVPKKFKIRPPLAKIFF